MTEGAVLMKPQRETLKDLYGYLADGKPAASKGEERQAARKARTAKYKGSEPNGNR